VHDTYRDQLVATGHHCRSSDIALLADLGLAALRFPVLWERVSPAPDAAPDWNWSDSRLAQLRELGIRPIVGLLHHGSGPSHTSLIASNFAPLFAEYAAQAASRYPWVLDWSPVNEPLTTARFSALYGFWYPHARDERLFWLALLNQIDATRLAMRAIRAVQPQARLIQPEDLGRTYATPALAGQAAFDNQRRWMTWDLLCGMVTPSHPLWERLCGFGLKGRLRAIADDPCPPDIIGINHYLTSDRLLDERLHRYPSSMHGGNGTVSYCDVEAVRALVPAPHGLRNALQDTWDRYRLPIALTEVHNGCTREEQIRWLAEAWSVARQAQDTGIDVRAVTAWALFGSKGWNTLLTQDGVYEAGAFDTTGSQPRKTALATAIDKPLANSPPYAGAPGWWRRDVRLLYAAIARPAPIQDHKQPSETASGPPLLIMGATGTLGRALAAECRHRDIPYVLAGRDQIDLLDADGISRKLDEVRPWAVINAAGWVRVDEAEAAEPECMAANAHGAASLARLCRDRAIPSVSFSSDLVFGGQQDAPYREGDTPDPLNAYGRSKALMEERIGGLAGKHLVIRTAAFFSPDDQANFAVQLLNALRMNDTFRATGDCIVTPTYVPDLCRATLDLLIDMESGLWHLTNEEAVDWASFARRLLAACGGDGSRLECVDADQMAWIARRPRQSGLVSERGRLMPSLQSAVDRFANDVRRVLLPESTAS
jgi:dTDP-4-dehydrorhamnose reductase